MKNSYLIIICALLLIEQRVYGESVTQTIHFSYSELRCDTITGGDGLVYSMLTYQGIDNDYDDPGSPALPIKYVVITLPYTADNISLSMQCSNVISLAIDNKIFPVQEQVATSIDRTDYKFVSGKKDIYESAKPYPSEQARIAEISCVGHGDRLVVVAVYPIKYRPLENRFDFIGDMVLTVSYNHSPQRAETLTRGTRTVDIGIPFYEYCVITSQDLMPAFTRLIAWKREKGLNAGVICKDDILNNTYIVGDTVSSYIVNGDTVSFINDDAGKIRQYLQYAYKFRNYKICFIWRE